MNLKKIKVEIDSYESLESDIAACEDEIRASLNELMAAASVIALSILAFWGAWRTFTSLTIPQRASFLIPLATYPIIYYFVAYMPRYRVPIDWLLFILVGTAVHLGLPRR